MKIVLNLVIQTHHNAKKTYRVYYIKQKHAQNMHRKPVMQRTKIF